MIEELAWKVECWWREYVSCHLFRRTHSWAHWKIQPFYQVPPVFKIIGRYCTKCGRSEEGKFDGVV